MLFRAFRHIVSMLLVSILLAACGGGGGDDAVSGGGGPQQSVAVAGVITYEDKKYDNRGFTGETSFKTLRYVVVDLVNSYGQVVDTSVTDENGQYVLSGTGAGLYVRVLAQTGNEAGSNIVIHNHTGDAYAITQPVEINEEESEAEASEEQSEKADVEVTELNFSISLNNDIAGVFNMLDVFTSASLFLSSMSTTPLEPTSVYWQTASSSYGTYFCPSSYQGGSCPRGKGIYILGGTGTGGDTDEDDDDVLMHEYAHYIETAFGVKDSPGGTHYLTDNDHDLRLAWSEGWGGFFPNALKTWMKQNDPDRISSASYLTSSYFVDTYGSYASISIDVAAPNAWFCPGGEDCFIYSTSEISVAKVLSELQEEYGMESIWNVISGYMASGTSNPATLETFWDGWQQQRAPGAEELQSLSTILTERKINFEQDIYEQDDTIADAKALDVCNESYCSGEQHFLYKTTTVSDVDVFSFSVSAGETYFIETLDLSNGTDTYLRLLDGAGNVVVNASGQLMVNDDRPGTTYCYQYDNPCRIHYDDTMLSSSLTFTPTVAGTYYVEVKSSPDRPVGSGRYGTYSIRISEE